MTKVDEHRITIKDLRKFGILITPGNEYFKDWPKPKRRVSLKQVQKILAKIPGTLSQEIAQMREEEG